MQHRKQIVRYSEKEIRSLLRLQQTKDVSVAEFCESHNISKARFYKWRSRYPLFASRSPNTKEQQRGFIPVCLDDQVAEPGLFAEIELSSNVRVKLFQKVDASYFKALLS